MQHFCGKSERLKLVGCFRRGAPSLIFDEVLNANLFEEKISSTACVYTRESWAPPAPCFSWVVLYLMLSDNFGSVFFLQEDFQGTIFTLLEVVVHAKNCCLCCFLGFFSFVLLVDFDCDVFFVRSKLFRKSLDNPKYNTTEVYPSQPAYWEFICMHLFLFV